MKTINLEQTTLDGCVREAQLENIMLTQAGKPVAFIVGIEGVDEDILQLGTSDQFWNLINERRQQKTISRAQLEAMMNHGQKSKEVIQPT